MQVKLIVTGRRHGGYSVCESNGCLGNRRASGVSDVAKEKELTKHKKLKNRLKLISCKTFLNQEPLKRSMYHTPLLWKFRSAVKLVINMNY